MADKPRVKAPKQRAATAEDSARRRKTMAVLAGVAGVVLGFVVVAAALGMFGGESGKVDAAALRTTMQNAGCTFVAKAPAPAKGGSYHSVMSPGGTSPDWNTDPPAAGAHYGGAAIFGIYEDELEMARVVHNLEHGGVYILYGKDVPEATVDQLRGFYESHKTGTIMAPLDRLGDRFALGAWVVESDAENGYLAKCTTFDEAAVSSFFRSLQFQGPERFDPSQLQPGH